MGGLATRYAVAETVDGRKVADEIGLVITLGTPHTGSPYGNIGTPGIFAICGGQLGCLESKAVRGLSLGSQQLRELPKFPGNLPVKAIAGNVTERNVLLFGLVPRSTGSDLVVPVKSATDEYTVNFAGDGREVVSCEGVVVVANVSPAPCQHSALPDNPEVQELVKRGIRDYLAATPTEPEKLGWTLELRDLTIPMAESWQILGEAEEGQASVVDTSTCNYTGEDTWKLCASFTVIRDGESLKRVWDEQCADALRSTSAGDIGGKTATVYEYSQCDAYESPGAAYLWHVPGEVAVEYRLSPEGKPMKGLKEALAGAHWK